LGASREPARPASDRATAASDLSNAGVLLENNDVIPGICSVKVTYEQRALPHLNRRTRATIRSRRPAGGQSASDHSYRPWTCDDRRSQFEHAAVVATGRTKNVSKSASDWTWSIALKCGRRKSKL